MAFNRCCLTPKVIDYSLYHDILPNYEIINLSKPACSRPMAVLLIDITEEDWNTFSVNASVPSSISTSLVESCLSFLNKA